MVYVTDGKSFKNISVFTIRPSVYSGNGPALFSIIRFHRSAIQKKLFNDVPFAPSEGPGIGIPANFGFTSLAVVNASMITVFKV